MGRGWGQALGADRELWLEGPVQNLGSVESRGRGVGQEARTVNWLGPGCLALTWTRTCEQRARVLGELGSRKDRPPPSLPVLCQIWKYLLRATTDSRPGRGPVTHFLCPTGMHGVTPQISNISHQIGNLSAGPKARVCAHSMHVCVCTVHFCMCTHACCMCTMPMHTCVYLSTHVDTNTCTQV